MYNYEMKTFDVYVYSLRSPDELQSMGTKWFDHSQYSIGPCISPPSLDLHPELSGCITSLSVCNTRRLQTFVQQWTP